MRKVLSLFALAAAAAIAYAGTASAADMPLKAPSVAAVAYSWSGLYVDVEDG